LKPGGIVSDNFTTNLLLSLLVKYFFNLHTFVKVTGRLTVSHPVHPGTVLLTDEELAIDPIYDGQKTVATSPRVGVWSIAISVSMTISECLSTRIIAHPNFINFFVRYLWPWLRGVKGEAVIRSSVA